MATEELPLIGNGDCLCNDILLMSIKEIPGEDIPPGGFTGKFARDAPVARLKEQFANRLNVPPDGLCFAVDGRDLDDEKTIGQNGILEPGPAARRAGARIVIAFMLADGVEPGSVVERRRADQEAEEREQADRLAREQAAREAAREQAIAQAEAEAAAKAKVEADALAEVQARQRQLAREADQCTVRCIPLGGARGTDVRTYRGATIGELAQTVAEQQGMRGTQGTLMLTFNGEMLPTRTTLREAGIGEGSEIYYFWEGGD